MSNQPNQPQKPQEMLEKQRLEYLFDSIDFKNRVIRLSGSVGDSGDEDSPHFTFREVDAALSELERLSPEPIKIRINSFGGEVYEAQAIVGRITSSSCHITTEGYGAVMSAATLILMCGKKRRLSRFTTCMFHKMTYGIYGTHDDNDDQVKQAAKEQKLWATWYEKYSNKKVRFWMGVMKKKQYYPTPEQMVDFGAVDELF